MSFHRLVMAVALAAPVACASPQAHGAPNSRPAIDGVDVEQVARISAGVPLRFSVYGTPGATVALRIEGGWHALALRESEPGVYEGTYVIDSRDAIAPASRVTATLQQSGQLARADLDAPLVLVEAPIPWADAAVRAAQPAPVPVFATAVGPGTASPAPAPQPVLVAASPERMPQPVPVAASPAPMSRPVPVAVSPVSVAGEAARPSCDDCALVESVRQVETPPGPLGAIAGAVAGAVLGEELGREHTRRMLRVLGAIGGAVAGREVERKMAPRIRYDVVLRTADGGREVHRYERMPPFAPGATVRLGTVRGESAPSPF